MNDSIMTSSLTARLETGMEQVTLRAVSECSYNERMAIRDVRNQESVRRSMYTDHIIEVDEHNRWIDAVIKDNRQIVFAVIVGGVVSGAVSLSSIDHRHKKSDWAFYLDHTVRGGLGAAIEFFLLDYAFFSLGLEKLNCEVIETNTSVVKMHKRFGFENEGFRRSNIIKNGERIGVHFMGITKEEWASRRGDICNDFGNILGRFSVSTG